MSPQIAIAYAELEAKDIDIWKDGAQDGQVPEAPVFSPVGLPRLSQTACYQRVSKDGSQRSALSTQFNCDEFIFRLDSRGFFVLIHEGK